MFARAANDSLGNLLTQIDRTLAAPANTDLRAWATFLSSDQPALDAKLVDWSRQHNLRAVPVGVFEDGKGPPSYRINSEAEVTILLAVKQKVVANFAFRPGELTSDKVKEILAAVPRIIEK